MIPDSIDKNEPAAEPQAAVGRRARLWPWALAIVVALVAIYLVVPDILNGQPRRQAAGSAAAPPGSSGGRGGRGNMPVPVVAVPARQGAMPVYLNGLGTVTSLNTVIVRSRVDGQLMSVAFREGQLVRKGELLAVIDPRPFQVQLTQAQGQLAKDLATLKNAQMDVQRYQALFGQDAVPRQQLDTAIATVNQYEGVVKSDQAAIESAKLNLTYSRISSPVTGRVGLRLVDPGNIVRANDANGLITITERQPIGVLFTIPGDSLPPVLRQLHAGRRLTVEAWDRDLRQQLATGRLLSVDNAIDQATGTVRLKAEFANEDETLFPNQFVNARLLVDTVRDAVIVPAAAVQRSQQSAFVYVVPPDGRVELRNVNVGLTEGDRTAVSSGLRAGESVVIEGIDRLQPGTRVIARAEGSEGPDRGRGGRGGVGAGNPNGATSGNFGNAGGAAGGATGGGGTAGVGTSGTGNR